MLEARGVNRENIIAESKAVVLSPELKSPGFGFLKKTQPMRKVWQRCLAFYF